MSYKWHPMRQLPWNASFSIPKFLRKTKDYLSIPERETSLLVSLPVEILNEIAQYLSLQDILNCSATCSRLRSVFNDNIIWRKFCKSNIVRYLNNAKQKLNVDFDVTPINELDEICEQRLQYMKQSQLLSNWKQGKFKDYTIHANSGLYYMSLKSGTHVIYNEMYLFLYDFHAHKIVIWNINNVPIPYTSIRLLYHNYYYEGLHYEIVGKKLVVYEVGKLIQIYDINLPDKTLPLVGIIIVENQEPLHRIPEFSNPEEMYAVCYHRVVGGRIYSHRVNKPVVHIWDVEKRTKIRALNPPKECSDFDLLSATNDGNDLILYLEINDQQRQINSLGTIYEVFSYSFSRDFFKTFWANNKSYEMYIPFHALQHKDLVILFCKLSNFFIEDMSLPKTVLVFYDYKWAMIIGDKSFPELVCHRQTRIVENKLLLATAFCLYIMDIKTQDIVYSFKYDGGKIELLDVFDGNFFISTPKSLVTVSKTKRKEVWDIRNKQRCMHIANLFSSPYSKDSVFVNESFTKLIIVGKGTLSVLNFW